MQRALFSLLLAGLLLGPAGRTRAASVATGDGLGLDCRGADGAITAVRIGGRALKLNGSPGGFYVADMIHDALLSRMDYRSEAIPGTRVPA